jgi:hypothetical protein
MSIRNAAAAALLLTVMCGARTEIQAPVASEQADAGPNEAGSDPAQCVDLRLGYEDIPATVMLLVDHSGSMNDAFGDGTRWSTLQRALFDPEQGVVSPLENTARFGMMLYTSFDGFEGGVCPVLTQASIALGNAEVIRAIFDDNPPIADSDTPTGESIQAAIGVLQAFTEAGPKHILLVTDGEPDTCAVPDPQGGEGDAIAAAQAAHATGIKLTILGVSNDIALSHLQRMANAGAGQPLELIYGVDPSAARPYQASDDAGELALQLQGILGYVRSCMVAMNADVNAETIESGVVEIDGQELLRDSPDGYRLLDGGTLELLGQACSEVLNDAAELVIRFSCKRED